MLTDSLPARHTPGSPWRVALLALVVMFVAPLAAQAQSATPTDVAVADIALEAQPLENALVELSRQSGIGIFAAGDLVEGLQAPPLNGSMTMEQALERLLEGTGLTWQRSAEGGYVVMPPNAGTADPAPEIADIDSAVLPSVNVSPDEHSTPNMAQISPGPISCTSSMSSACIRTRRGTLTFLPVRELKMMPPRRSTPWYTRMYVSCPKRLSSSLNARPTSGASVRVGRAPPDRSTGGVRTQALKAAIAAG